MVRVELRVGVTNSVSELFLHLSSATVLRKNLASAKIVKIGFNANLDLLGFPHFITFKECRKVP